MDLISIVYYVGVFLGYTVWMFYLYWMKHDKNPTISFDRKYLIPWIFATIIAAFQLIIELIIEMPIVSYPDLMSAFIAGLSVYIFIQEFMKGILKNPRVDYFNT